MAFIAGPLVLPTKVDLNIEDGLLLGGEFTARISYGIVFTPMEILLAQNGLRFLERIDIFEINPELSTTGPADSTQVLRISNIILSSEILSSVDNLTLQGPTFSRNPEPIFFQGTD